MSPPLAALLLLTALPAADGLRVGVRTADGDLVTLEVTTSSISAPGPGVLGLRPSRVVLGRVGAVLVDDGVPRPLPSAKEGCSLRIDETLLFASARHVSLLRAETEQCGGETTRRSRLQSFARGDPARRPLTLSTLGASPPTREGTCLVPAADEVGLRREEGRARLRVTLAPAAGCAEPARAALLPDGTVPPGPALPPAAFAELRAARPAVFDALPVGASTLLVGRRGLVLLRGGKAVATLALSVEAVVMAEPLAPAAP